MTSSSSSTTNSKVFPPNSTISTLSLSSSSSSSAAASSPCAACKFLRRKCHPDCVFAPYFPPDNPQKFVHVHRIFGASNVAKLLNDLPASHREDAAKSLAYEADMRLKDPVYGCVGVISVLQHQLRVLQEDLYRARAELARYRSLEGSHPIMSVVGSSQFGNNLAAGVGQYSYYPQQQNSNNETMTVTNNYDVGGGGGGAGQIFEPVGEKRPRIGPS